MFSLGENLSFNSVIAASPNLKNNYNNVKNKYILPL